MIKIDVKYLDSLSVNQLIARFALREGKGATHVPEQIVSGKSKNTRIRSVLQFGFGRIVTKIP